MRNIEFLPVSLIPRAVRLVVAPRRDAFPAGISNRETPGMASERFRPPRRERPFQRPRAQDFDSSSEPTQLLTELRDMSQATG
jgi:hypothetical protein